MEEGSNRCLYRVSPKAPGVWNDFRGHVTTTTREKTKGTARSSRLHVEYGMCRYAGRQGEVTPVSHYSGFN